MFQNSSVLNMLQSLLQKADQLLMSRVQETILLTAEMIPTLFRTLFRTFKDYKQHGLLVMA
jgi:hypothetical protein